MYDELVKQLRFCAATDVSESPYPCDGCSYDNPNDYGLGKPWNVLGCSARMMMQAADAIEELSKPRWIPVAERCPEKSGDYLVFDDCRNLYVNEWHCLLKKWQYDDSRITHWQPLPQPPEEG